MKISPIKAAILGGLLASAAGIALAPVVAQDTPESLLPPGFNDPAPAPAPAPRPADTAPRPSATTSLSAPISDAPNTIANGTIGEEGPRAPVDLSLYELPDHAKRSLARVGVTAWGNRAFPVNAFGRVDGHALMTLMHRLDAPVASRWVSIALRRALQSPIDTPRGVNGADFAAERAWLLLRMGESIAARAVVQEVDAENYTPMLYRVALQSALAAGDPGAVCPIADAAAEALPERAWAMARAWCASLGGQPTKAQQLLNQAQNRGGQGSIDNVLAEKIVGAGGRGAVTIEWQGVTHLTAWRWGLATATGEQVPDSLYASAGPQVRYWMALSPTLSSQSRARWAEMAAAQGVFSNAGLVSLYGEIAQEADAASGSVAVARDLRTAHTGADAAARLEALKTLWTEPESQRLRYARLILTARAASQIPANPALAADADKLIASMLSAGGFDSAALAWRGVAARGSDGWMMLALADPRAGAGLTGADFDAYRGSADRRRAQLALAGLAGLGKLADADAQRFGQALGVQFGAANNWTRAIDGAARAGDPGMVTLLAAVGMQVRGWGPVSPETLFHIVAGFRAAGMPDYARLIAIEAITRA